MKKNAEVIIECLILAASFVFVIFFIRVYFPFPHTRVGATKTNIVGIYPNPIFTPGVTNPDITQANINQTICNPKWSTKSIRPSSNYTTMLKEIQLGFITIKNNGKTTVTYDQINWGIYSYENITKSSDAEEDHFISLELAGNPTDPKNLWPQPYHTSIPDGGAKNKDAVENYLHKEVCNGAITLKEAQKEITTDWYAVYKSMNSGKLGGIIDNNDPDDI